MPSPTPTPTPTPPPPVASVTPRGRVTNPYGGTQYRVPGGPANLPPYNVGVDIGAPENDPVYAPVAGTVRSVYQSRKSRDPQENHGWGGSVVIRGDDGRTYRLSHLAVGSIPANVREGQRVAAGQPIGAVGMTGNATGPHVDVEARDAKGNPLDFTKLSLPRTGTGGDTTMADTGTAGRPAAAAAAAAAAAPTAKSARLVALEKQRAALQKELAAKEDALANAQIIAGDAAGPLSPEAEAMRTRDDPKEVERLPADIEKLQTRLDTLERDIAAEEDKAAAAAAKGPTTVATNTTERFIVERDANGVLTSRPNPNYVPPKPEKPDARRTQVVGTNLIDLDTGQVIAQVPREAAARRTQIVGTNLIDLDTGQVIATLPEPEKARRTQVVGANLIDLDTGEVVAPLPEPPQKPQVLSSDGRAVGINPQTGERVFDVDLRSETQKALDALDLASKQYAAARQVFMTQLTERVARGEVSQPDALRLVAEFNELHQTRAEALQAEANQRLQDDLLSRTTGYQYQNGAVVLDAAGAPAKTVEQLEREADRAQKARDAERAEAAQRETERSNRTRERQNQDTNAINLQNADETARTNLETTITNRMNARTDAVQAAGSTLLKDNIGPARQAADLGAASLVLSRSGLQNLFRTYGASTGIANGVLAAYDDHQGQLAALRAQVQPVRRATLTPLAYSPPPPGAPGAPAARPVAGAPPPPVPVAYPPPPPPAPEPPDAAARRRGTV